MSRPIEKILEALDRLDLRQSRNGSGLMAQCPAHEDRTPSLSISEADDRVLLRCFAGCEFGEIMKALGLEEADAFEKQEEPDRRPRKKAEPKEKPKAKLATEEDLERWQWLLLEDEGLLEALAAERAWLPDALKRLGIGRIAGDKLTIAIPTRNAEGELIGLIRYLPIRSAGQFDSEKSKAAPGSKRGLFPHPSTLTAAGPIFLLEGEADAITAASLGLNACGIPGAKSWRKSWAKEFAGREIVVVPDADEPGEALAQKAKKDLLEQGCSVRILRLSDEAEIGEGGDLGDYTRMMLAEARPEDLAQEIDQLGRSIATWAETLEEETLEDGAPKQEAKKPERPARPAAELLAEVEDVLRRFVVLPSDSAFAALSLWALHTHAFEGQTQTPYILLTSAEKRCGKSRVLEVLEPIVREPWATAYTSAAAMYRKIERDRPTMLLDELDAVLGGSAERAEALRGLINAGNRAKGRATVCEPPKYEPRDFSVFSPKLLAGIETAQIPDTVRDRSIPIRIERRKPGEIVERLILAELDAELEPLNADLAAWAEGSIPELSRAMPDSPAGLHDRAEEAWRPLLAIADHAGGEWPARARAAATELSEGEGDDAQSYGAIILREIRELLGDGLAVSTVAILKRLNGSDELPFGGWRDGKGLDARTLAKLLKPYGIKAKKVRLGSEALRGYHIDDLAEPLERFAPLHTLEEVEQAEQAEHGTDVEQETPHQKRDVPYVPHVPHIEQGPAEAEHLPEQGWFDVEQEGE